MENTRWWLPEGIPVESVAYEQIKNMAALPILHGPVAIMPDVHYGKGATVGSVIPTEHAIIPAAVGVDLGCGMVAFGTSVKVEQLPDNLSEIRSAVEKAIPVGFNAHERLVTRISNFGLGQGLGSRLDNLKKRYERLALKDYADKFKERRTWEQIGTLGGGNHFIEMQTGDDGYVWLMLHSGSRNIGKVLAEVAINLAKKQAKERLDKLPDQDLAWLAEGTPEFKAYVEALLWAQDYAALNRDMMAYLLWEAVNPFLPEEGRVIREAVNCHHNYVEPRTGYWLTRKGAVSARKGELGIIPGSMGTKSYIVRGLGNPDSYESCSHGAGRRMSRGQAKREFTVEDLQLQTVGVESRKDAGVIDEIPGAYKDIDAVMAAQKDLVEPVVTLKQVLCVKG